MATKGRRAPPSYLFDATSARRFAPDRQLNLDGARPFPQIQGRALFIRPAPLAVPCPMQRTQPPPSPPLTHSRSSPSLIKSSGSLVSFTTEPTVDHQALPSSLTSSSPPTAVTASIDHSPAALAYAKKKSPSNAPRLNGHNRKNSTDDLAGEVEPSPPPKTVSDARLLYRQWRAGTLGSDSAESDPLGTSPNKEFIAGILQVQPPMGSVAFLWSENLMKTIAIQSNKASGAETSNMSEVYVTTASMFRCFCDRCVHALQCNKLCMAIS